MYNKYLDKIYFKRHLICIDIKEVFNKLLHTTTIC